MGADLYLEPDFSNEKGKLKFYFRDSYNDSNLLWKLGLSWWDLSIDLKIKGKLTPSKAKVFLRILEERKKYFKSKDFQKLGKEEQKYFKDKFQSLVKLLKKAIMEKKTIVWSV